MTVTRSVCIAAAALMTATMVTQPLFILPSSAQSDVIVRPEPVPPVAVFPARPDVALAMPEVERGEAIPIPLVSPLLPWSDGPLPTDIPSATPPADVGGKFTPTCTACRTRQF